MQLQNRFLMVFSFCRKNDGPAISCAGECYLKAAQTRLRTLQFPTVGDRRVKCVA